MTVTESIDMREDVDMPLYDFLRYPAEGVDLLEFFRMPVGVEGKTLADTNMFLANALPSGRATMVAEIGILPWCSFADRRALLSNGVLELQILDKLYFREPLERFLSVRSLRVELHLMPMMNFGVNITWARRPPQVSADVRLGVFLDGIMRRALA
jgi:hypothetical protein